MKCDVILKSIDRSFIATQQDCSAACLIIVLPKTLVLGQGANDLVKVCQFSESLAEKQSYQQN
jgi:hypothetical protein